MIVATGAFHREPEHGGAASIHAINRVFGAKLFINAAAFVGLAMETIERGGDALFARGIRQQVAGELPSGTDRKADCR